MKRCIDYIRGGYYEKEIRTIPIEMAIVKSNIIFMFALLKFRNTFKHYNC